MTEVARPQEERMPINIGHGHVYKRPDGVKARCGGPGICTECSRDLAQAEAKQRGQQSEETVDIEKKALANLLHAVEGFLWFSWADSDLDADAAQAIDRLRLARDEYGTVQRVKNG